MSNTDTETTAIAGNSILIQGVMFPVKAPYAEGHPLTAGEASQLNQVLAENLRNNFAGKVKDAKAAAYVEANGGKAEDVTDAQLKGVTLDDAVIESLRAEFTEYAETYEFGVRRGGRIMDPVEREINRMAEEAVKAAIKGKGIKLSSVADDKFDELVRGFIEAKPELREEAERRVRAAQDAAGIDLSALTG